MASDLIRLPISLPASADLSTKQFYFCVVNSDGQLAVAGNGAAADTVLQDKPNAQLQPGLCCGPGDITKVLTGDTVTAGDLVASDASGTCVPAATGDYILGRALETGTSGVRIRIRFMPMGVLS